jgi:tRNA-splicing ligase RtcB (3'-phosphate/5'-hydroxy nucleic acid ligase)
MSEPSLAPMKAWLAAPLDRDVSLAIERLRRAPDVQQVAVMPDVHLAADVCIGVVVATSRLIYPQAVGGDIGCGMLAVAFDIEAAAVREPAIAGRILSGLARAVPARRRNRRAAIAPPPDVAAVELSDTAVDAVRHKEGLLEFATLGGGNHFIELQSDEDGRLWLMVHSGSRAIGPAIRDHHLSRSEAAGGGLRALEADTEQGSMYLHDVEWARRFADASRRAMAHEVDRVIAETVGAHASWDALITTDHNHVALEPHGGRDLWVHRKGAMPAWVAQPGVLPGSMGTSSFHVEGRGHEDALCSSAHGSGRALSRSAARRSVTGRDLHRQMHGIWYDYRLTEELRDEAPAAYKDIRAVLRAQSDLVKVTRVLHPVLNYKAVQ